MQKLQKFHIEIANASIHLLVYVRMYSTVAAIAATRWGSQRFSRQLPPQKKNNIDKTKLSLEQNVSVETVKE